MKMWQALYFVLYIYYFAYSYIHSEVNTIMPSLQMRIVRIRKILFVIWSCYQSQTKSVWPGIFKISFYLFLAAIGLCCHGVLFSNCVEWGPLSAVASLIAEQTASGHTGFSTGHGWAQSLQFPGFGALST